MNKPWKVVLVLLGIFIAGGVSGAFLAKRYAHEWFAKRPGPDQWAPNHVKRLTENLNLPTEQAEVIRPIVRRNMTELNKIRDTMVAESRVIMDRMQREIAEKLTPAQRAEYDRMNIEMREKYKKQSQERGSRPPGADHGRPEGSSPEPAPKSP